MRGKRSAANKRIGPQRLRTGLASSVIWILVPFAGYASAEDLRQTPAQESALPAMQPAAAADNEPKRLSNLPAILRNNEAVHLSQQGLEAEAEQAYRAALELGCEDELVRAKIQTNLGSLYERLDRYPEAERMFRSALALRQKNLPPSSVEVAYAFNNLAEIYRIEGRELDALKLLETAVRRLEQSHADAAGLPLILTNLAPLLCRFNQFDKAKETLRSALILYDKHDQSASRSYGIALNNLGQIFEFQKKLPEATEMYEQAIRLFENLGSSVQSDLAAVLANTGAIYLRLNRLADAFGAERRALGMLRPGADVLVRAQVLWNLGNITVQAGQPAAALPYFEQSLATYEERLGSQHVSTISLLFDYASATKRAGNKTLSRSLQKRAESLLAQVSTKSPTRSMVSLRELEDPDK